MMYKPQILGVSHCDGFAEMSYLESSHSRCNSPQVQPCHV